jgi:hypothetical protein
MRFSLLEDVNQFHSHEQLKRLIPRLSAAVCQGAKNTPSQFHTNIAELHFLGNS